MLANIKYVKTLSSVPSNVNASAPSYVRVSNESGIRGHIVALGIQHPQRGVNGLRIKVTDNYDINEVEDYPYMEGARFATNPDMTELYALHRSTNAQSAQGLWKYSNGSWSQIADDSFAGFYTAVEFGADNKFYAPPLELTLNEPILVYDPETGYYRLNGEHGSYSSGYYTIVANRDRTKLYALPYIGATRILKIDVLTGQVTPIGPEFPPGVIKFRFAAGYPWHIGANGKIYVAPEEITSYIEIDPETDNVRLFGNAVFNNDVYFSGMTALAGGKFFVSTPRTYGISTNALAVYSVEYDTWVKFGSSILWDSNHSISGTGIDFASLPDEPNAPMKVIFPGATTLVLTYNLPVIKRLFARVARQGKKTIGSFKHLVKINNIKHIGLGEKVLSKLDKNIALPIPKIALRQRKNLDIESYSAFRFKKDNWIEHFVRYIKPPKRINHLHKLINKIDLAQMNEKTNKIPPFSHAIACTIQNIYIETTTNNEAYLKLLPVNNDYSLDVRIENDGSYQITDLHVLLVPSNYKLDDNAQIKLSANIELDTPYIDITGWLEHNNWISDDKSNILIPHETYFHISELDLIKLNKYTLDDLVKISHHWYRAPSEWNKLYVLFKAVPTEDNNTFKTPLIIRSFNEIERYLGAIDENNPIALAAALQLMNYPDYPVIVSIGKTIEDALAKLSDFDDVYTITVLNGINEFSMLDTIEEFANTSKKHVIVGFDSFDIFGSNVKDRDAIFEILDDYASEVSSQYVKFVMNPVLKVHNKLDNSHPIVPGTFFGIYYGPQVTSLMNNATPMYNFTLKEFNDIQLVYPSDKYHFLNLNQMQTLSNHGMICLREDEITKKTIVHQAVTTVKNDKVLHTDYMVRIIDYVKWYITKIIKNHLPMTIVYYNLESLRFNIEKALKELATMKIIKPESRIKKFEVQETSLNLTIEIHIYGILESVDVFLHI
jgi:hypothetical protein